MNPILLRRLLTWVAPLAIGYVMKKYEARKAKKQQAQALGHS